jgi:hypothetical protein
MQLDDSPSLDQFKNGMPEKTPNPNERVRKFRILLLVLALVVAFIGLSAFLKNTRAIENITATGLVRGRVVDQNGQPFHGSIFILGTRLATQTDVDGNFVLKNVPAGEQKLIVADELIGRDFAIHVTTASELQMGEIRFQPTATP